MTWTAPEIERVNIPDVAGERPALEAWLDHHRDTLLMKCGGLTAAQLRERACPPSALSLLGLVRHMTDVERWWFRSNMTGTEMAFQYWVEGGPDTDFDVDTADPEADFAAYRAEVAAARAQAAERGLDETFVHVRSRVTRDVRWIYIHMIEEYARHNGHADLLRERIDGRTGE